MGGREAVGKVPLAVPACRFQSERLRRFEVEEARCFDRNEEAMLRRLTHELGRGSFNNRVRSLAAQLRPEGPAEERAPDHTGQH